MNLSLEMSEENEKFSFTACPGKDFFLTSINVTTKLL